VVEYRRFRNTDPPDIRRLWQTCGLGRGAALGCEQDAFETAVFAQPFFDPDGLIVAIQDRSIIGYVHAGFAVNDERTALDFRRGTILAVMVEPKSRRQGVGRELVKRAEEYLRSRGVTEFTAGPAAPADSFYFGLYGGSQPAGFLASDPLAAPFFLSLNYAPAQQQLVFQRDLGHSRDPIGLRLMGVRRSTRLAAVSTPASQNWWWLTRAGRLEALELGLVPKSGSDLLASVTIVGLDFYLDHWAARAIGLVNLQVAEGQRRKGYGQGLLVELCRRVKDEMVNLVEAHAAADDLAMIAALKSANFQVVDEGTVYRRD
jgi:ribosomal protein S18 acetylase RimI-like enzyme